MSLLSLASRLFVTSVAFLFFCTLRPVAFAHQDPKQVIEGTYVVTLLLQPQKEAMQLRWLFHDIKTGKQLSVPVSGFVEILDAQTKQPFDDQIGFSTNKGKTEMTVVFPHDGLYEINLAFQTSDRLGHIYRGDAWEVWMPGTVSGEKLPFGLSEWLTVGLGVFIIFLVGMSILQNRRRKSTIETRNAP